jgi:hypothetical protein
MERTRGRWRTAVVLLLVLWAPSAALAGPYLGNWGWWWHPSPDCPPGLYCPLHYWAMRLYRVRACLHPSYLDQYPPGPCPAPPAPVQYRRSHCQGVLPWPTPPYAVPDGYYGREIIPQGDAFTRAVNLGRDDRPITGAGQMQLTDPSPGQVPGGRQ